MSSTGRPNRIYEEIVRVWKSRTKWKQIKLIVSWYETNYRLYFYYEKMSNYEKNGQTSCNLMTY